MICSMQCDRLQPTHVFLGASLLIVELMSELTFLGLHFNVNPGLQTYYRLWFHNLTCPDPNHD